MPQLTLVLAARPASLPGALKVRRVLPRSQRREVGPFAYLDHLGPVQRGAGGDFRTPAHAHAGLATLTYLYSGAVHHRDSLGNDTVIIPGAVNWMSAGRGIVHVEATAAAIGAADVMHGLQFWVALPAEAYDDAPSFHTLSAESIPEVRLGDGILRLAAGRIGDLESPLPVRSPLFLADLILPPGGVMEAPLPPGSDGALYAAQGAAQVLGHDLSEGELAVIAGSGPLRIAAPAGGRFALFGGAPLPGARVIWDTYILGSRDAAKQAAADFAAGRYGTVAP